MLDAFAGSSYKLRIAGQGPLQNKVDNYRSRYCNIEFLGSLTKNEVLSQMQSCTALIFPSNWFEGMPLTIIEAFACGTPVIASNIGAMRNMIEERYNGLFFETDDKDDLLCKLSEWQSLPGNEKQQYAKNALVTYETYYTPQVNAKQLLSIYNDAVSASIAV